MKILRDSISKEEIQARASQIHWFHNYELLPGVMTNGFNPIAEEARRTFFQIPQDLQGKRVLDVGCADGYYTFLAESRGASVVAIDAWPHQGFALAHEVRGSKAEFHQMDVYDLQPETLGMFDIVFFMGVYYHLKNPLLALERIASVTRELAIIESQIMSLPGLEFENEGFSRFYEYDELALGDSSNWWVPNIPCLLQTIRAAGFPRAELIACHYDNNRGIAHAYKGPRTAQEMVIEDIVCAFSSPTPNAHVSGTVQITGVAFSKSDPEHGIERISIYLDQLDDPSLELGQARYGIWQASIAARSGDRYGPVGFEFTWDTARVIPGRHTLYVFVEGKRGWFYSCRNIVVESNSARKNFPQIFQPPQNSPLKPQVAPPENNISSIGPSSAFQNKLAQLDLLGQSISVSPSIQPGWLLASKVRHAFHNLTIY